MREVSCSELPSSRWLINQLVLKIFIHVFLDICQDRREAEEEDEIISSQQVANMFLHWTDPEALSKAMWVGSHSINSVIGSFRRC